MNPIDRNPNNTNPYAAPQDRVWETPSTPSSEVIEGEFRPLRTVWFAPRATVRRIVSVNPTLYVLPFVCLAGIGSALDRASLRNLGDQTSLPAILTIAVILGPLGGLLGWWIGSHLIRISGAWIGGIADSEAIRTALAWASLPNVLALFLWIPQLALFGSENFTTDTPQIDSQPGLLVALMVIGVLELTLGIWTLVLLCNMIAEVQNYRSAWKGLGNLILAGLLLFGAILGIVIPIALLSAILR
ncbi:MAG: Yip1 family protein [Planctomycetota bacterium]|jgi:hypothetical protein